MKNGVNIRAEHGVENGSGKRREGGPIYHSISIIEHGQDVATGVLESHQADLPQW